MPRAARRLPTLLASLLLHAAPAAAQSADPWAACAQAAAAAERTAGLPDGILAAVGRVESGRTDPASGRRVPWPHAVNVDGAGRWLDTAADAIAHVQAALAARARFVDVGCFQVNLQHHPAAFASLAEAFDPAANAAYAARLLARHFAAAGSWDAAVGRYHSLTPRLGEDYAARVMAEWQGRAPAPASNPRIALVVWRPGAPVADSQFGVRVFVPSRPAR